MEPGMTGEGFDDGYQSLPVNWGTSSAREKGFFELLSEITGAHFARHQPAERTL